MKKRKIGHKKISLAHALTNSPAHKLFVFVFFVVLRLPLGFSSSWFFFTIIIVYLERKCQ